MALRVCSLVSDGPARVESVTGQCCRCGEDVWIAAGQIMPVPDGMDVRNICTWCAVMDEKIGEEVARALRDLRSARRWAASSGN